MTDREILDVLKKIFEREFECNPGDVNPEAHIYNDLELDSLDSVDLIVALENEYNFKVNREKDETVLRNIRTVTDVMDYIRSKQKEV